MASDPLAEIREAIAQEKSSGDFKLTFNDYRITIVDKKIRLKSYYFGSEKLVEFSEFEERLLAFYKEFPYYSGE